MKKDFIKGITMVTMIVVIAFAMAAVSANAQSAQIVVSNVPFEFVVGDKALPAGEYRISSKFGKALTIQSADANGSTTRLTIDIRPRNNRQQTRLVFHKYGERYFLAEVWSSADNMGRKLLKSRQERAIERENSSLASKTEQAESGYALVEVAAVPR